MDYNGKMREILRNNEIKVKIIYLTDSFVDWDKNNLHSQYKVILERGNKKMKFDFWDSIYNTQNGKKPTVYDVIACLEWYEIEDFENFCLEFGYDTDSIKALKIYLKCQKQQKELFEIIPEENIRKQIREII